MSYEETARVELENTVRKLLERPPGSGRQTAIKGDDRTETGVKNPYNVEKTAHDFRASLNIIIGFTELMLDEATGKINKEQRRSLNDILSNGKRLLDLSDDIVKRLEAASGNPKSSGILPLP
jgi:hypothetical protein